MAENINKTTEKNDQTESVTFKISENGKQKLLSEAEKLGMSLSEYIRIKVMLQNETLNELIVENNGLKERLKEALVRNSVAPLSISDGKCIVLNTTKTGKKVLIDILDELKYRNRLFPNDDMENGNNLSVAISVIVTEFLAQYLEEFRGIRHRYHITLFDHFYRLLFKPYYDLVFNRKKLKAGT